MIGLQLPMLQAGAAAGAVPGPANWTDIVAALSGATNEQTISVGEATVLRAEISSTAASGEEPSGTVGVLIDGALSGEEAIGDGATFDFTVNDGDVVKFTGTGTGFGGWSLDCVVTIKYGAPSFASTLDTFNVNLGS